MPYYRLKIGSHRDLNKRDYNALIPENKNDPNTKFSRYVHKDTGMPQPNIVQSSENLIAKYGHEKFELVTDAADIAEHESFMKQLEAMENGGQPASIPISPKIQEEDDDDLESALSGTVRGVDVTSEFDPEGVNNLRVFKKPNKRYDVYIGDEVQSHDLKKADVQPAISAL